MQLLKTKHSSKLYNGVPGKRRIEELESPQGEDATKRISMRQVCIFIGSTHVQLTVISACLHCITSLIYLAKCLYS